MRSLLLAAALLIGACSLGDDGPTDPAPENRPSQLVDRRYQLVPASDFAAPTVNPIAAIAWDGAALWVVTDKNAATYYEPDRVEIYRMDLEGHVLAGPIVFEDHYEAVVGAVWIDGALWMNYSGGWGSDGFLRAIDLGLAGETRLLGMPPYFADLEVVDGHLAIAHGWNRFQDRSLENGSVLSDTQTPYFQGGDMWGIAMTTTNGGVRETWLSDATMNELAIVSGDELVAYAIAEAVPGQWHRLALPLQFAGDRLALVGENHVYVYDVVR